MRRMTHRESVRLTSAHATACVVLSMADECREQEPKVISNWRDLSEGRCCSLDGDEKLASRDAVSAIDARPCQCCSAFKRARTVYWAGTKGNATALNAKRGSLAQKDNV